MKLEERSFYLNKKKKKLLPFSDQEAICSDFAYPRAAGFLAG